MPAIRSVTVYAASSRRSPPAFLALADELGRALAERGLTTVYGGANIGVMGSLAHAALQAGGRVEGVILDKFTSVAHDGLHVLDTVEDMRSRKAGLAARGDAFVALPGAFGTLEEVSEILVERQLHFHAKPLILINYKGFWDPLLAFFDRQVADGILAPEDRAIPVVVEDSQAVIAELDRAAKLPPPPTTASKID